MVQRQQNLGSHVDENRTIIGAHTEIKGNIEGTGELVLHGRVHGDIELRGILQLQEGGMLRGDVVATQIIVDGAVLGDLRAEVSLVLRAGARVVGAMQAPRIQIMEGAQLRGEILTQASETDRKQGHYQAEFSEPALTGAARQADALASTSTRRGQAELAQDESHSDSPATVIVREQDVARVAQKSARAAKTTIAPKVAGSPKAAGRGKKRAQRREAGSGS